MPFKLQVADRNYESFTIINSSTLSKDVTIPSINPIEHKLLNQDIFDYDVESQVITIQHSTTRSMPNIPGVLVLEGNKRYGKHKKKFLYKCIPDDRRLPIFRGSINGFTTNMLFSNLITGILNTHKVCWCRLWEMLLNCPISMSISCIVKVYTHLFKISIKQLCEL